MTTELDTTTSLAETVSKAKIVGKALYLEFEPTEHAPEWMRSSNQVTQIIMIPAGMGTKGTSQNAPVLYTRTVSKHSPKAQWRKNNGNYDYMTGKDVSKSAINTVPELAEAKKVALESINSIVGYLGRSFMTYASEEHKLSTQLRKKPIVVEVTSDDIQDSIDYKTPSALVRRIQKARVSLDFPEKLV
jgi:hypothetical protein